LFDLFRLKVQRFMPKQLHGIFLIERQRSLLLNGGQRLTQIGGGAKSRNQGLGIRQMQDITLDFCKIVSFPSYFQPSESGGKPITMGLS